MTDASKPQTSSRPPALVLNDDDDRVHDVPDEEQKTDVRGTASKERTNSKDPTNGRALMGESRSFNSFSKFMKSESRKRFWYSLPKITKATLVLSLITTVVLVSYSIVMVSLKNSDEEAHVTTTIIILSLFQFLVTLDAVVYENTLQLIASIVLNTLMMVRVLWFIATKEEDSDYVPLKVVWGALVCAVVLCYIVCSLLSCRTFGWRFYSRLGVDFRRPGAKAVMRMTLIANVFNTLLKFDFILLVVFCALGITIAVEGRDHLQIAIFVLSICTFFLNLGISVLALIMSSARWKSTRIWLLHVLMPLSLAGPIAIIVIYYGQETDIANAATSTLIAGIVFMVIRLLLWMTFHVVANDTHMVIVGARATLRRDVVRNSSWNKYEADLAGDEYLAPMLRGSWLGKPTPRNPKKTRFFQLSHDASTLRWGWKKFVRMYYVEDIEYSLESLSIRLTFLLDPELLLVFPDTDTFLRWQNGIERLMVVLMSPEAAKDGDSNSTTTGLGPRISLASSSKKDGDRDEEKGLLDILRKSLSTRRSSGTMVFTELGSLETRSSGSSLAQSAHKYKKGPPPSTAQLQKRQRMANYLFGGGNARSPFAWMGSFRRSSDGFNVRALTPAGKGSVVMVSVGVQTDPSDLAYLEDICTDDGVGKHGRHKTDDDKNADIAAQYAAMFEGFGGLPGIPGVPDGPGSPSAPGGPDRISNVRKTPPPWSGPKPPASPLLSENSAAPQSSSSQSRQNSRESPAGGSPASSLQLVERLKGLNNNKAGSLSPTMATSPPGSMVIEASPQSAHLSGIMISVEVVDFDNITMGKLLGSGSEGDVHAAWYLESPVAVKRFNRLEDASHEAGMYLSTGNHDNIVSLRALCQHNDCIYLVMEYCPRGTLDSMLHYTSRSIQWHPLKLLPLIRGICRGMYHLHSRSILHRDLKPANIFIGHGSTMKIGDFGMACIVAPGQTRTEEFVKTTPDEVFELVGTLQYTAPELVNPSLRRKSIRDADLLESAKKVDVYSFGVTLWEILERRRPYEGIDSVAIQGMWINSPYTAHRTASFPKLKVPADERDPVKLKTYQSLSDLIDDCLRLDSTQRPTFQEILKRLKAIKEFD